MFDDLEPVDLDLIRSAAPRVRLSPDLRRRVLAAAAASHEQISRRRQMLRVACLLVVFVALAGWLRRVPTPSAFAAEQLSPPRRNSITVETPHVDQGDVPPQELAGNGRHEWQLVDAWSHVRRHHSLVFGHPRQSL